jgi:hypothetical protein
MLWTAAAALGAAAVGSVALGLLMPLERVEGEGARRPQGAATKPAGASDLPPLASFEKVWNTPLRAPLGAAVPQAAMTTQPVVVTPPPGADGAPPPVSLVGTIGTSLAMLKTPANTVEVAGIGETVNGVTVLAVRPAEVDVMYMNRTVKLVKPPEAQ